MNDDFSHIHLAWVKRRVSVTLLVGFVVLLGTVLRFYDLGAESLWLDEVDIVLESLNMDWGALLGSPTHLVERLALVVGRQDYILRFPFAVAGILSIAVFYRLVQAILDVPEALVAALLLSVSPFHIWYSQESRYYSLLVLFTLFVVYFLWKALQNNKWWAWLGFGFAAVLGVKNVAAAFFPLASLGIFAGLILLRKTLVLYLDIKSPNSRKFVSKSSSLSTFTSQTKPLIKIWLPFLLTLLLIVGLIFPQVISRGSQVVVMPSATGQPQADLAEKLFEPSLDYILALFSKYSIWGHASWRAAIISWVVFVLGLVSLIYQRAWKVGILVLLWLGLPFVVLTLVSFKSLRVGTYYHLIFILPAYLILVGLGITNGVRLWFWLTERLPGPKWIVSGIRFGVIILALAISIRWTARLYPNYYQPPVKEQWREVADWIDEDSEPGTMVIFNAGYVQKVFDWYSISNDEALVRLPFPDRRTRQVDAVDIENLPQLISNQQRVWMVFSHEDKESREMIAKTLSSYCNQVNMREYAFIRVLLFDCNE